MADNVSITAGTGTLISTEEVTTLNGAVVTAQQVQRVITGMRTADGTVIDGSGMVHRLDAVNDAVTAFPVGHSFTNITTNSTTTVKTGAGVLRSINFNNPSAITVASLTLTIYDNTAGSGTLIGTIVVPVDAAAKPFDINYDVAFTTGLTLVTAGPTVAMNLTVEWR